MTAEQLRNSILQEAISGRLVPQDPNDEPASVLLQRIREERESLVAKKELKKADLVVSEIDNDVVFDIPEGWEWVTIDQIAIVKGGKRLPVGKTFSAEPTPYMYIRVTEMKNNTLIECEHKYISKELRDFLGRYTISSADIYVTIAGTIGAVGDVPEKFDGMNLTENALKLSYLRVNKKYLIYALSSPLVQSQFKDKTNKVGQPKLAMERVKNSCFPLPPLAEQKRIVAKLEELLPIVEQYGKAQKELDELNAALPARLRQSILQEAISGRLVPQDPNDEPASVLLARIREEKARLVKEGKLKKKDLVETPITEEEIPFEIPASWEWVRHNELFDISGGTQPPKSEFVYEPREGYIRLYQIRDYGKTPQPVYIPYKKTLKISKEGDILLARYGASLGKVFFAKDGAYNVAIARVIPQYESELINTKYIYWYYKSSIYQHHITDRSRCAQAGFNKDDLNNLYFPLPPLAEQKRIVAKIEELFEQIDKITK